MMIHTANNVTSPTSRLLEGYLTEEQLARETDKSCRTLRAWRQKRIGPPFVMWGATVLYPRDGFSAYLKSLEQAPRLRNGKGA
jgi:hypothetical protein